MNLIISLFLITMCHTYGKNYNVNYGWEIFEYTQSARTASLGGAVTADNNSGSSSMRNPVFSKINKKHISITHQDRFLGMLNTDFISLDIKNNKRNINLNLIYESIGDIPDTRNVLLDWGYDGQFGTNDLGEGNGILDEGERLDIEKINFFTQSRIGIYGASTKEIFSLPVGFGLKIISTSLNDENSLGLGFDIGTLRKTNKTTYALILENFPSSGVIWNNGSIERTFPSLKIGLNQILNIKNIQAKLLFSNKISLSDRHLDSQFRRNNLSMDFSFGSEIILREKLFLRVGKNYVNNLTGGLGVSFNEFNIDYAFLNSSYNYDLGSHHIISFSISYKWISDKLSGI